MNNQRSDASRTTITYKPKVPFMAPEFTAALKVKTGEMYNKMRDGDYTHENSVFMIVNSLVNNAMEYELVQKEFDELKEAVVTECNECRKLRTI